MPGIDLAYMCHELNINQAYPAVKQKPWRFSPEKSKAINDEVDMLLEIGVIEECKYPNWISNPVVVKKKKGKDRVCVYILLIWISRAQKIIFLYLRLIKWWIQLLDILEWVSQMHILDIIKFQMKKEDRIHITFTLERGFFCYKVMLFGLKNARTTYQKLMNKMFVVLLGRTMEIYIDDMVIKSKKESDHVRDLDECFQILRKHGMHLNPTKCAFRISSSQFLGHMVSRSGIEANPTQ